jgi:zinc protease
MATASQLFLFLTLCIQADPAVEELKLHNGLTAMLRPIPQQKSVALVLLFNIGGDHDPQGKSGLAHLVEHLYCVSAAGQTPARTYEQMMRQYPQGSNAQTGDRYTVYAVVFPKTKLERELTDAAARMGDLRVTQADLAQELPRMQIELANMFGRIPVLGASNHARELLRPTPLGGRKGGRMEHLQTVTVQDAQEHWRKYYKPRNAILVVAGSVDGQTRGLIEKHFGPIAAGEAVPAPQEPGKPQFGTVKEEMVASLIPQSPTETCLAFAAPAPTSADYAPFLVLLMRLQNQGHKLKPGRGAFPVQFMPLDEPTTVYVKLSVGTVNGKTETGRETLTRMEKFVAEAVDAALNKSELAMVAGRYGTMLGTTGPNPFDLVNNPYGVAFGLARRRQLGLDGAEV